MRTFSRWSCSCLRLCLSCTSWQCCGFGNYGAARWKIPQAIQHIRTLPRWAARSFSVTSFNPLNPLNPHTTNDTIYALSTAAGRAAIAVVRISGPRCLDVYRSLCPQQPLPRPRRATLRKLSHPQPSTSPAQILDSGALVLFFPAPKTVTGEDVLELHIHGGPATVRAVLEAIPLCLSKDAVKQSSIRFAEAGEFTKRAFYNGRVDLTQVEALGEILVAETEQQRRLAIRSSSDSLSTRYESWRTSLLSVRGELEALIDFSEDQHFDESPGDFLQSIRTQIQQLTHQVTLHIDNAMKGELLRNGISVALLGAPNAGKSSLLNRIVGREAAIVSVEEGTTRDIIDVSVDIGGWLCRLGDMAGLRGRTWASRTAEQVGAIEQEGIRRARERAMSSDLVLVVLSLESPAEGSVPQLVVDQEVLEATTECILQRKSVLVVINKIDQIRMHGEAREKALHAFRNQVASAFPKIPPRRIFGISCKDAAEHRRTDQIDPGNLQGLLRGLTTTFEAMTRPNDEGKADSDPRSAYWQESLSATERQRSELERCRTHLQNFLRACSLGTLNVEAEIDIVAAAEDLRSAAGFLARITGKGEAGDVEDVLGVVFEKFCVGK